MFILNLFSNNDTLLYGFGTLTLCFMAGLYIYSNSCNTRIDAPNSPRTFNLSHDQLKEINDILDKGGVLDPETITELDQDFQSALGPENYSEFEAEMQQLQDEFQRDLQNIFENFDLSQISNSGMDYTTMLDIMNTISNLISYFYL
jgi:hypothetical protein